MRSAAIPKNLLPDTSARPSPDAVDEPLYHVIIHNDDVTPMDFVVRILQGVFYLDNLAAFQIMYSAHYHGQAHVQTLPKPEAIKRVGMAHFSASLNHYPLHFSVEVASS